ncbi:MAG: 3-dehydroquinate synthase [Lachnospiraceae bacterium]|nr:3-dehydroquinate synthase [Lachnospiraceae bacterium]
MKTITVHASKTYEIRIGSGVLSGLPALLRELGAPETVFVVSDDTVFALYGRQVTSALAAEGFRTACFVFPHGEEQKSLKTYEALIRELVRAHVTRSDVLVALGGGTVGDLAGFAAATFERGIRYVQIPTTLLAAVDSSVGGKTGVDLPEGKNLVGAIYQPAAVLTDIDTFRTLPKEQYLSGAAETLKYGMIGSAALFDRWSDVPIREIYEESAAEAVSMKRDLVELDEKDEGPRMLLNFGHTFGHAAEACSGYRLPHGYAVAMGMAAVTRAAAKLGYCSAETPEALEYTLKRYELPTEIPFRMEELLPHLLRDKKIRGEVLNLVIPERIGRCVVHPVELRQVGDWLEAGGVR